MLDRTPSPLTTKTSPSTHGTLPCAPLCPQGTLIARVLSQKHNTSTITFTTTTTTTTNANINANTNTNTIITVTNQKTKKKTTSLTLVERVDAEHAAADEFDPNDKGVGALGLLLHRVDGDGGRVRNTFDSREQQGKGKPGTATYVKVTMIDDILQQQNKTGLS